MPFGRDLAVLTVYYNPCGYRSTVANFLEFFERMQRQGVAIRAVELAFGKSPFRLPQLEGLTQLRTRDVLWQKERLFNHQITQLPANVTKVAWIDADLLLDNDQWHRQTYEALDQYPVVQPFATAVWLDREGRPTRQLPGIAAAAAADRQSLARATSFHPGFAWAARREFVQRHGLFDRCILGGGDRVFAHALFGIVWPEQMAGYPQSLQGAIDAWARRVYAEVRGAVGYIEGSARHLWHGNMIYRQYLTRDRILVENDYQPDADVQIGDDGAWRWATDKPRLHEAVREFFYSRREDGSDPA